MAGQLSVGWHHESARKHGVSCGTTHHQTHVITAAASVLLVSTKWPALYEQLKSMDLNKVIHVAGAGKILAAGRASGRGWQ